jgi:dihydrofolate synthase/folylpolyglutamate synthase
MDYLKWLHSMSGMKLGLENITKLMLRLGNPEKQLRFIHVAGTNGKGSVTAMTSSILREAGFCVGMYTSPHLVHYNERIQVDGVPISDFDLARLVVVVH